MKKTVIFAAIIYSLFTVAAYAYDCTGFLGTWDVTTTFESGSQGHVVWIFTDAAQDVALGYNEKTNSPIQVAWSDSKGQYRLFYPENSSMGDTWISLLNDTLTGYTDLSSVGRVTFKGTKRPGTGPTTTTTSLLPTTSTTTSIEDTTSTTTSIGGATTTTTAAGMCAAELLLEGDNEKLDTLRQFRDEVLMKSEAGEKYVKLYYKLSPAIIRAMEENPELKIKARTMVDNLLPVIKEKLK
jgi:hypothetical protein